MRPPGRARQRTKYRTESAMDRSPQAKASRVRPGIQVMEDAMKAIRKFPLVLVLTLVASLAAIGAGPLSAAELTGGKEVREFEILLKGKPTGSSKITIQQQPGERTFVTVDAAVEVNVVVYVYKYEFHGTQTWVADRLEKFDSSTVDGGKKSSLTGVVTPQKSDIVLNNNKRITAPVVAMTTDYWRLPAMRAGEEFVTAIDASTGTAKKVRINRVAEAKVPLGNTMIPCTEYRLTGDVDAHVWLDAQGRVVRQQSVEDGHPTELRLTKIYMAR